MVTLEDSFILQIKNEYVFCDPEFLLLGINPKEMMNIYTRRQAQEY